MAARPRISRESDAERFEICIVFRTELLLWRNERSWKFCVSDRAVEREETGCENERPKNNATGDRMDSLGERNQAGNAGDDEREQANRHQDDQRDNDSPRVKVLLWRRHSVHRSWSLVSTGLGRVQLLTCPLTSVLRRYSIKSAIDRYFWVSSRMR